MNSFLRSFITEWRKLQLPVAGETFVVAVSGGADSASLLLALSQLKQKKKLELEFVVAHFDHALRKESGKDEAFVKKLSVKLGLRYESEKWESRAKNKENLEQSARNARYEFLGRIAEQYHVAGVLTGHTINDQAETFLLRLLRGSGIDGLGAMKPVRRLNDVKSVLLVRPLLNWAQRADTEEFCRSEKIKYREDPMNRDEAFLRVRIRKQVLPLLQDINPQIVTHLAKLSSALREEGEAAELAAQVCLVAAIEVNKDKINVKQLTGLPAAVRKRVLRLWLSGLRGDLRRLDMKHFTALERLAFSGTGGKRVELPGGEIVTFSKGRLIFKKTKVEKRRAGN
jgi:tRNA(Ile)-lysidine synthase